MLDKQSSLIKDGQECLILNENDSLVATWILLPKINQPDMSKIFRAALNR